MSSIFIVVGTAAIALGAVATALSSILALIRHEPRLEVADVRVIDQPSDREAFRKAWFPAETTASVWTQPGTRSTKHSVLMTPPGNERLVATRPCDMRARGPGQLSGLPLSFILGFTIVLFPTHLKGQDSVMPRRPTRSPFASLVQRQARFFRDSTRNSHRVDLRQTGQSGRPPRVYPFRLLYEDTVPSASGSI